MDKKRVSIHEAGHVVMFQVLNQPIEYVEIRDIGDGRWNGNTRGNIIVNDKLAENNILIALSGIIAEEIFYGKMEFPTLEKSIWNAAGDFDKAYVYAQGMVGQHQADDYIISTMVETRKLLTLQRGEIEKIATELERKQRLSRTQIFSILLGLP